ncbi:MAG: T9SS type A sorting domain-containing protein, partial [Ignavibacteriales bacterium]|nr:T9SS type A sorting domain-containing protein [Ignavibacteriales bacterium]
EQIPESYKLYQNYPNPFNPTTTIQFDIPQEAMVTLKIYNLLGQEVATLINNELMTEGMQEVEFNASSFASGVYFYRLSAEGIAEEGETSNTFHSVHKMILVK